VTGVTLAMHYSPNVLEAFNSIEHIMRDVNNGIQSPYIVILLLINIVFFILQSSKVLDKNLAVSESKLEDFSCISFNDEQFKLDPWFVTGFVDAEGSFSITVIKDPRYKAGYRVEALFSISLHKKDVRILELIQAFFGGAGKINFETKRNVVSYLIRSKKELAGILLPHFDQFPLITQKWGDYILFKEAFELISKDAHLTEEGLKQIVAIKAKLNLGLSDKLKVVFPILPSVYKPLCLEPVIPSPYWVAGFTSGEGCFYVKVSESSSTKSGSQVQLSFYITQHIRDKYLLSQLISYFEAGRLRDSYGKGWASYECSKFSDLKLKIIPFFNKYSIVGVKNKDFQDWCKIANLVETKDHLTEEGLCFAENRWD
jgi:hypothetical protein